MLWYWAEWDTEANESVRLVLFFILQLFLWVCDFVYGSFGMIIPTIGTGFLFQNLGGMPPPQDFEKQSQCLRLGWSSQWIQSFGMISQKSRMIIPPSYTALGSCTMIILTFDYRHAWLISAGAAAEAAAGAAAGGAAPQVTAASAAPVLTTATR